MGGTRSLINFPGVTELRGLGSYSFSKRKIEGRRQGKK